MVYRLYRLGPGSGNHRQAYQLEGAYTGNGHSVSEQRI